MYYICVCCVEVCAYVTVCKCTDMRMGGCAAESMMSDERNTEEQ